MLGRLSPTLRHGTRDGASHPCRRPAGGAPAIESRSAGACPATTLRIGDAFPMRRPSLGVSSLNLPAGFGLPAFSKIHRNRRDRGEYERRVHRRLRVSAVGTPPIGWLRSPLQSPMRRKSDLRIAPEGPRVREAAGSGLRPTRAGGFHLSSASQENPRG